MKMTETDVIEYAKLAHKKHWTRTSDPGTGTKNATKTCGEWQRSVLEASPGERFEKEAAVASDTYQRIDLLDHQTGTAYELKSSANNPHHEFYKDIFKALAYNAARAPKEKKVKTLVFLVPEVGAAKLRKPLPDTAITFAKKAGITVKIAAVDQD